MGLKIEEFVLGFSNCSDLLFVYWNFAKPWMVVNFAKLWMVASPWLDPWICVIFLNSYRALKGNTEKNLLFFTWGVWICVFSPFDPIDLLEDYFSSDFNSSRVLGFHTHGSPFVSSIWMAAVEKGRRGVGEGTPDPEVRSGGGRSCLFNRACRCRSVGRSASSRAQRFQPAVLFREGASPTRLLILGCRNWPPRKPNSGRPLCSRPHKRKEQRRAR
jgi:hypothetical protein